MRAFSSAEARFVCAVSCPFMLLRPPPDIYFGLVGERNARGLVSGRANRMIGSLVFFRAHMLLLGGGTLVLTAASKL